MFLAESAFARLALFRVDSRDGRTPPAASSACVAFDPACALSWLHSLLGGFFNDFLPPRPVFCASVFARSALVAMSNANARGVPTPLAADRGWSKPGERSLAQKLQPAADAAPEPRANAR
jgi:hypothetical protein